MHKKFYLDTSIWRDYFEDRKDSLRPLGEFAFQFLKNCAMYNCQIFYSEVVLFELGGFSKELVLEKLSFFQNLLLKIPVSIVQMKEAKQISAERNLATNDVLHAILARDNNATLITRDAHFKELFDVVDSKAPEEALLD
jgi:predicted nucleic acid-binding protein